MHDFGLGPPVDVGAYDGPMVKGKPLHSGSCEDGVYGCRKCNDAGRLLSTEKLEEMGWPTTGDCDYCKKQVPVQDIRGLRPWDEPSCYYEVCKDCKSKHDRDLAEAAGHDQDEDDEYISDEEWDRIEARDAIRDAANPPETLEEANRRLGYPPPSNR